MIHVAQIFVILSFCFFSSFCFSCSSSNLVRVCVFSSVFLLVDDDEWLRFCHCRRQCRRHKGWFYRSGPQFRLAVLRTKQSRVSSGHNFCRCSTPSSGFWNCWTSDHIFRLPVGIILLDLDCIPGTLHLCPGRCISMPNVCVCVPVFHHLKFKF